MCIYPMIMAGMAIVTLSTTTPVSDVSINMHTPTFTNGPIANPTSPTDVRAEDQVIFGSCIVGDSPPINYFLYSSTGSPQCYDVDDFGIKNFSIYAGYLCMFYE